MPLRCLLFSSHEEMVQPIWQVLADLGIEGEYCQSAVDAVEKVTTQVFQIVITDWDDQPEAGFLLKTARELKAAQRPLTLAIVSDGAKLPEALQAGANSVLVKPIRTEQVRDTMSTACELLRAKQPPGTLQPAPVAQRQAPETAALAASASAGPVSVPANVTQVPEKTFRAGEFLQSGSPMPGAQFDTENEVHKAMEQSAAVEVDALTELEPMASAVETAPAPEPEPQEPLTGWASLQARLTKNAPPPPPEDAPAKGELLSYAETPAQVVKPTGTVAEERKEPAKEEFKPESGHEAALFAYMSGEPEESAPAAKESDSKIGRILLVGILAACVAVVAMPQTRQSLRTVYRNGVRAGLIWLNPPPAPVPQAVPQHDSFGQSGDEYNLPAAGNVPDGTTDPSQIRVVPVIDPTAKPQKGSEADSGQAASTATGESNPTDQVPTNPTQTNPAQTDPNQPAQNQPAQNQPGQGQGAKVQGGESQVKNPAAASGGTIPGNAAGASSGSAPAAAPAHANSPVVQGTPQSGPVTPPVQISAAPQPPTTGGNSAGIPSSLKSQMASMTPEASGAKPAEAAMSSIEPVNLPESAALGLLAQPVDPIYPDIAKASGQRGSVVLQVFIGRDGAVQDAKFLQGSLVFARAAIDAVKQWRFKPYSMNGRAVSVQTVITLNFKPPA
jgi:TonB family protein